MQSQGENCEQWPHCLLTVEMHPIVKKHRKLLFSTDELLRNLKTALSLALFVFSHFYETGTYVPFRSDLCKY